MHDNLETLQEAIKQTYRAIVDRDYERARTNAQQAGTVLESLEGELDGSQEEARIEALSALGDGLQADYHGTQETQGIRAFGRVVSNSRIILRRQLGPDEYTFDSVLENPEE